MDNKFLYPVTKETFHKYAESIFAPIRRGECVTTVWVPMAGRRMWNKFLIENISLFEKELPNYKKYLLVYIEPLDLTEESISGYIRLMAKSFIETSKKMGGEVKTELEKLETKIFDDPSASYSNLLDNLKNLLKDATTKGSNVVFFVGEFDELVFANKIFYNNLKSLWSGLYPRLHYVFLMRERVTKQQNINQWGELNEAILQNIVYIPLGKQNDINYWLDKLSIGHPTKITETERNILIKLCGGHPYLLKVAVRCLLNFSEEDKKEENLEESLLNYYELQSVAKGIVDVRTDNEKNILKQIAQNTKLSVETKSTVDFLLKIGLVIKNDDDTLIVSGKLIKDVVLDQQEIQVSSTSVDGNSLRIDEETGAIVLSGKTIEATLTRQEYILLSAFLKNDDKLYGREEIGSILWGKASYEKYSDWAIDQLMSKLRKKLEKIGTSTRVVTVRGRGYKIILH